MLKALMVRALASMFFVTPLYAEESSIPPDILKELNLLKSRVTILEQRPRIAMGTFECSRTTPWSGKDVGWAIGHVLFVPYTPPAIPSFAYNPNGQEGTWVKFDPKQCDVERHQFFYIAMEYKPGQ